MHDKFIDNLLDKLMSSISENKTLNQTNIKAVIE